MHELTSFDSGGFECFGIPAAVKERAKEGILGKSCFSRIVEFMYGTFLKST